MKLHRKLTAMTRRWMKYAIIYLEVDTLTVGNFSGDILI